MSLVLNFALSEEKIVLLLFLLNALKRWISRFVQDWNTRLADYNSMVKNLEKSVREGKKRSIALPAGLSSTSIAFSLPASSNPTKKHQRPSGVEGETPQTAPSSSAIQASNTGGSSHTSCFLPFSPLFARP
ncbi:unnamed protein product, partial [Dibothriocephalus latus]